MTVGNQSVPNRDGAWFPTRGDPCHEGFVMFLLRGSQQSRDTVFPVVGRQDFDRA